MSQLTVILACVLFLFAAPATARVKVDKQHLDEARSFVQHKDYHGAYRRFKKMASRGCPYSQCIVGVMHQKGIGAPKDIKQSMYWFRQSAKQGFAEAQYNLGKLYLGGEGGISRDAVQAEYWLKKSAQNGLSQAQYELGKLYLQSADLATKAEGRNWLQKAIAQGCQEARDLASKLPDVPVAAAASDNNAYGQGLQNVEQSWAGYGDVINALNSANTSVSKQQP